MVVLLVVPALVLLGSLQTVYGVTIETDFPIAVNCTNPSNVQLCVPPFSTTIATDSLLKVQYFVPQTHCSSVRVHIFLDGNPAHTTGFLSWFGAPSPFDSLPLDSGIIDLGTVTPGMHTIDVQAEGQVSGCNNEGLARWKGTAKIFTSSDPPQPTSHSHEIEFGPTILGPTAVVSASSLVMTECPPGHVMTGFTAQSFSMRPKCNLLTIQDFIGVFFAVGGKFLQIDTISILLAYAIVNAVWMAPIGIGIGLGLYLVKRKL